MNCARQQILRKIIAIETSISKNKDYAIPAANTATSTLWDCNLVYKVMRRKIFVGVRENLSHNYCRRNKKDQSKASTIDRACKMIRTRLIRSNTWSKDLMRADLRKLSIPNWKNVAQDRNT